MAKTKTKLTSQAKQKLINVQHEKEFLNKLRNSFKIVTGEDLFKFIPPTDYKLIIFSRARPMLAVPEKGESIPSNVMAQIQQLITYYVKIQMISIEATQNSISLVDFYSLGLTLSAYCEQLNRKEYKTENALEIKQMVDKSCLEFIQQFDIVYDKMNDKLFPFLSKATNRYWEGFYSYKFGVETDKSNVVPQFQVVVKLYQPEKKNFSLSSHVRPAFRIGWTFKEGEFQWIFLLPSQLGMEPVTENQQIPVYIQAHAIQRLFERIDCINEDILIPSIYDSLRYCTYIPDKGNFLIELSIVGVKIGYLSAVMFEGSLIIRTFLFLTFNGTPEGKRLEKYIGLKMLDRNYLKMDKLSSFMTSKLSENEELRSIFQKADCLHLVELYDKLDRFSAVHPQKSPIEMLARYLEKERVE